MTDPLDQLETLLDQLMGPTPPETTPDTSAPDDDQSAPKPLFANVGQFVDQYLSPVVERRVAAGAASGIPWCRKWWAHPEALSRIYALWRAWECLRVSDPATGMSIWWRDHLDPHLAALTSDNGPLARCRPDRHVDPVPLPVNPIPQDILDQLPDSN